VTRLLPAFGDPPPAGALDEAAEALAAGGIVVVPTDTVYGVAVDPRSPGAAARLFALKRRPPDVPLPVLVADRDQALALADDDVPDVARRLMERFWPGGLTVVVRRRPGLAIDLGGPDDTTIGLRVPAHPVPVALAVAAGPLATTSANRHGEATPARAADVADHLGAGLALVLDAGACQGEASTVVSCVDGGVRVLRQGSVPVEEVLAEGREGSR
jgi:L-threonylcarbamoyladenylate synthase